MFSNICFSWPLKVLMIYLLSAEKKKNDPLLPDPYPELKMFLTFCLISRDLTMSAGLILSKFMI